MTGFIGDRPVLWLRTTEELDENPPKHALLWPAIEFTASVYTKRSSRRDNLDPFQRAVLGAAKNGVLEIRKQAELLCLNEEFVAHISEKLVENEMLTRDEPRKPTGKSVTTSDSQEEVAVVRVYQDAHSGAVWPRYIFEHERRRLTVGDRDGYPILEVGTHGTPREIRVFAALESLLHQPKPSGDDVIGAVYSSAAIPSKRRVRNQGLSKITQGMPVKLSQGTGEPVYLCCPNRKGHPGLPNVDDPFGHAEWRTFIRGVKRSSGDGTPLYKWLYNNDKFTGDVDATEEQQTLHQRLRSLNARVEGGAAPDLPQIGLDLEAIGSEAIDALWARGTESVEVLATDPYRDHELIQKACIAFGFETLDVPMIEDLYALAINWGTGSLAQQCAVIALRFRSGVDSPLHHIARSCPDLFSMLGSVGNTRWTKTRVERLWKAVNALVEGIPEIELDSNDRGVSNG